MKNRLFAMALAICASCSGIMLAQNTLNIHQKSGSVVSYGFDQKPVITYENDNLHLHAMSVSIDYPLAELEKLTFSDRESSIGELHVEGSKEGVRVFTLEGKLVCRSTLSDGVASLQMNDLPAGTYVVKDGKTSYKIMKH